VLLDGGSGVQDLEEVEGDPDMNVSRGSSVTSNIFEEEFWFREVEALRVDELRIRIRKPWLILRRPWMMRMNFGKLAGKVWPKTFF